MSAVDGYIATFGMSLFGWGFPAMACDSEDEHAVCRLEEGPDWLRPADQAQFDAWKASGKSEDPETLRRYGAVHFDAEGEVIEP